MAEGFLGEIGREIGGKGRKDGRGGRADCSSLLRDESILGGGALLAAETGSVKAGALVNPGFCRETDVP